MTQKRTCQQLPKKEVPKSYCLRTNGCGSSVATQHFLLQCANGNSARRLIWLPGEHMSAKYPPPLCVPIFMMMVESNQMQVIVVLV